MKGNRWTVEQEIAQADLINNLKGSLGEEGAQMAQEFISMDREEQERLLILMGAKIFFHCDSLELMALHIALKKINKEMPEEAKVLRAILCTGFAKIRKEEKEDF